MTATSGELAVSVDVTIPIVACRFGLIGGLKGGVGDIVGEQGVLDGCYGLDAGNFGEAVFNTLVEGDVLWRGVAGGRGLNGEEQEIVRVEAEAGGVEIDQRAREETCSDDEEHGERDLEDDDRFSGEAFAAAGG